MSTDSCRIIAIVNHKGGVGKTTTTINLGTALAKLKKKVLLIDMDPGAHATYGLGILAHRRERTVYDLMRGRAPVSEIKVEITLDQEHLDLVPASIELAEAEVQLSGLPGREFLLKEARGGREVHVGGDGGAGDCVYLAGRDPRCLERPLARLVGEVGAGLVGLGPAPLDHAGARDDPLVARVDYLLEIGVRDLVFGRVGARAGDADFSQAHRSGILFILSQC